MYFSFSNASKLKLSVLDKKFSTVELFFLSWNYQRIGFKKNSKVKKDLDLFLIILYVETVQNEVYVLVK